MAASSNMNYLVGILLFALFTVLIGSNVMLSRRQQQQPVSSGIDADIKQLLNELSDKNKDLSEDVHKLSKSLQKLLEAEEDRGQNHQQNQQNNNNHENDENKKPKENSQIYSNALRNNVKVNHKAYPAK